MCTSACVLSELDCVCFLSLIASCCWLSRILRWRRRWRCCCCCCCWFCCNRNPDGEAATAVAALKGGKVVGIVVTGGGSGYTEVGSSVWSFGWICFSPLNFLRITVRRPPVLDEGPRAPAVMDTLRPTLCF